MQNIDLLDRLDASSSFVRFFSRRENDDEPIQFLPLHAAVYVYVA